MNIFWIISGMLFLAAYGYASIFYAEKLWHFEHFMDVRNGEPTEWYIETSRIRGVILILIDIILIIALTVYYFI